MAEIDYDPLEERLAERVRAFCRVAFDRLADTAHSARIEITVDDYGWDEDGTPILEARIEERWLVDEECGHGPERGVHADRIKVKPPHLERKE